MQRPSPADPYVDFGYLKQLGIVNSRSALHRGVRNGWIPKPIQFPNGQIRWRESVIQAFRERLERGEAVSE